MAYCHQFPNLDTFNEKGKELLKYSICFMHSFQWISIHLFFHMEAFLTTSAFCHFFRRIHQLLSKHHTKMKKNNMKHFHLLSLKKPELDFSAFFVLVMDWFDFWSTTNWTQCFLMQLIRPYNTESFASNSVLVLHCSSNSKCGSHTPLNKHLCKNFMLWRVSFCHAHARAKATFWSSEQKPIEILTASSHYCCRN